MSTSRDHHVGRIRPEPASRTTSTRPRVDDALALAQPDQASATDMIGLQHRAGNQAVQRLLSEAAAREKPKVEGDEDKLRAKLLPLALQRAFAFNSTLNKMAPKRSNTDSSTTSAKNPTLAGSVVKDGKKKRWRYRLDRVEAEGTIQIVYFTADRYPAPTPEDDSGTLSNVTQANHKEISKDLKKNRTGIPDHWSAYRAEDLHEQFHWEKEWLKLARKAANKAESTLAKLTVGEDVAPTQGDAEKDLEPRAKQAFDALMNDARKKWKAMGDSPGDPPYKAQASALDALGKRVSGHAKANKW